MHTRNLRAIEKTRSEFSQKNCWMYRTFKSCFFPIVIYLYLYLQSKIRHEIFNISCRIICYCYYYFNICYTKILCKSSISRCDTI